MRKRDYLILLTVLIPVVLTAICGVVVAADVIQSLQCPHCGQSFEVSLRPGVPIGNGGYGTVTNDLLFRGLKTVTLQIDNDGRLIQLGGN